MRPIWWKAKLILVWFSTPPPSSHPGGSFSYQCASQTKQQLSICGGKGEDRGTSAASIQTGFNHCTLKYKLTTHLSICRLAGSIKTLPAFWLLEHLQKPLTLYSSALKQNTCHHSFRGSWPSEQKPQRSFALLTRPTPFFLLAFYSDLISRSNLFTSWKIWLVSHRKKQNKMWNYENTNHAGDRTS